MYNFQLFFILLIKISYHGQIWRKINMHYNLCVNTDYICIYIYMIYRFPIMVHIYALYIYMRDILIIYIYKCIYL